MTLVLVIVTYFCLLIVILSRAFWPCNLITKKHIKIKLFNVKLFFYHHFPFSNTTILSVFVQVTYSILRALCKLRVITSSGVTLLNVAALKRAARY